MSPILEPGIHDLSFADYLADPCPRPSLNSACAAAILDRSPMHAFHLHRRLNPDAPGLRGKALDLGTAFHALALEGEDIARRLPFDSYRTKKAQAARDEAEADGVVPLLEAEHDRLQSMWQAFCDQDGPGLLGEGHTEASLLWREGEVWCRARPDRVRSDRLIVNLKCTGQSAHPDAIARHVYGMAGYDMQAALQTRGWEVLTGRPARYAWLTIETTPPHGLSLVQMGAASLAMAKRRLERAVELWGQCLAANDWPGYPDAPLPADYPKWQEERWLAREVAEERGLPSNFYERYEA